MFEGLASRDKDPRKSLHVDDVPGAGARPRRGAGGRHGERHQLQHRLDLDLRAALDVRLPRALRPHLDLRQAARPAVPRRRLRPRRRGAAHRPRRPQVEARPGGRRALPLRRARDRRRPQRHDARPGAAHLGLRDQLRRPRRARHRQDQPADAQARPPDLGGGGLARAGEQHRIPPADLAQRRGHEARRRRPHLGRLRRPRLVRDADGPRRRRHPGLRRLHPRQGRDLPRAWAPSWSSTVDRREGYQFWNGTRPPRTRREWKRLGAKIRELTGGQDVDIVFEHPGRETFGATRLRRAQGRHDRHLRLDLRATCTSTTTATSG